MPKEEYGSRYIRSDGTFMYDIMCNPPKIIPLVNAYTHLFFKASRRLFLNVNSSFIGANITVLIAISKGDESI